MTNKLILNILIIFNLLILSIQTKAQNTSAFTPKNNKGRFYVYWGWNKEGYTRSDIHFEGKNYNFDLYNVIADDRQSPIKAKLYLNPANITIPQYNFRLGYFINEQWNISFGADHMKYVVRQNQNVRIDGVINETGSVHDGQYANEDIKIVKGFLELEHTDGLNYVNADIRKLLPFKTWKKVNVLLTYGLGAGVVIPRTDAPLLNFKRNDNFYVEGFGASAMIGVQFKLANHFFIQSEYKVGYINLSDIRTTASKEDFASQHFFFGQYNILFGSYFGFKK